MNGKYWDRAWSLVDGCTPCSPGCDNCWSAAMAHRFYGDNIDHDCFGNPYDVSHLSLTTNGSFNGRIVCRNDRLDVPLKRKKPTVWSIWNDLFHKDVLISFIDNVLGIISACPQHTFLALTKRAHLIEGALYGDFVSNGCRVLGGGDSLSNLWIGVTVCNQQEADEKIPLLLEAWPGKKWISIEPMLGEINFRWMKGISRTEPTGHLDILKDISCVILGGETGLHARPMHPDWVRSVRDQCLAAGVPFYFKQWGRWCKSDFYHEKYEQLAITVDGDVLNENEFTNDYIKSGAATLMSRKHAGRFLDGREHNDLPFTLTKTLGCTP